MTSILKDCLVKGDAFIIKWWQRGLYVFIGSIVLLIGSSGFLMGTPYI